MLAVLALALVEKVRVPVAQGEHVYYKLKFLISKLDSPHPTPVIVMGRIGFHIEAGCCVWEFGLFF